MFNFKSLRAKFLFYILSALFIVFVAMGALLSNITSNKMVDMSKAEFARNAGLISISFNTLDNNLNKVMQSYLDVIKSYLPKEYSLDKNRIEKVGNIDAPALYNGTTLLNNNFVPLEAYTKTTGVIATVFARMDDDFVRVSTTLKKQDGTRAFGTMLGQKSPALQPILNKETFYGKVKLFGKDYYVVYEPIIKNGKVIGILFIGYDFTTVLDSLKKEVKTLKINNTGYAYMMDYKGNLLIHPSMEGENIFDVKDDTGHLIFKDMLNYKNEFFEYSFNGEDKVSYVQDIENFKAVLVITDSKDELLASSKEISTTILIAFIITLILMGIILIVTTTKTVLTPLSNLNNGLLNFFKYLNKETKEVQMLDINGNDEFARMSQAINENMTKTKTLIEQDAALIDNVKEVVNEVSHGNLTKNIDKSTDNESLNELKDLLNEMLNILRVNISNDLNKIQQALDEYKKLNFTHRVSNPTGKTDIGLNSLADIINEMLVENKSNGLTLDKSSNILLENVDLLSKNSNEAAAALEETAAAIEEVTSNIANNTENVVKMANYANELSNSANEGQELAGKTTSSMDEINAQVIAINEAITVIDQIAFQTNILSLNAAVEAATAGEAGKGFAVVAQEVRNLASRSTEAAKEIKELVENANIKANEGKKISDLMIKGYSALNENVSKTLTLISDVETASKEQQTAIEQINDSINSLDRQTQQNAMIAAQAHEVALETDEISKLVVSNANDKEFIGKESVKAKSFDKNKK